MSERKPLWVTLTNRELAMGAECGIMRNIACLISGREPANGFDADKGDDAWKIHIEGACGEIAVAKLLGRFWSPTVNTFKAPDIGKKIQVRTRSKHHYDLYVRPETDDPEHTFVLATGVAPRFAVHGYLLARDAQRDEWVQTYGGRPPAWFVPQENLLDIHDLFLGAVAA
jgi:hypothetical protein